MEKEPEIWKDIEIQGIPIGLYQISSWGNVKSLGGRRGGYNNPTLIKQHPIKSGYLKVTLCTNKTQIFTYAHRLVAIAFIPNPSNKLEVNHKDGNKLNNNVINLEWCSHIENSKHADLNNLRKKGEDCSWSKLTLIESIEIRKKYIPKIYTMRKLSLEYNVAKGTISAIIKNKTWKP
jgi:hypothetical protein